MLTTRQTRILRQLPSEEELADLWDIWTDDQKRQFDEVLASLPVPRMTLEDYTRQAWSVLEPNKPLDWGWHATLICEVLSSVSFGEINNFIINIQPRHLKSTFACVMWPTWEWTFMPWTKWLTSSYSAGLATRDSLASRRLIQSRWYQSRFGQTFSLARDQNLKGRYDNTIRGYRIATTVGGASTGEGGDRVLVDDPVSAEDAYSEVVRKTANRWWDQTMSTRVNDPKMSSKGVIMQRLHNDDLTGHILKLVELGGEPYEHIKIQTEFEPNKPTMFRGVRVDPRKQTGELLHPTRFGRPEIEKLKIPLGPVGVANQLQQEPSPEEGGIFKRDDWVCWVPRGQKDRFGPATIPDGKGGFLNLPIVELPVRFEEKIQSWDFAVWDEGSYVVGEVWGTYKAYDYLLDQVRGRWLISDCLKQVRQLSNKHPDAKRKFIENKANGPAIIQLLRDELQGLIAVNPDGDKVQRAHSVSPQVASHNVVIPHPEIADWVEGFVQELADFDQGTYDDQVDTATQALHQLARRRRKENRDQKRRGRRISGSRRSI